MSPGLRRLYTPRPINIRVEADGRPTTVDAVLVEAIREEWVVEDRWWTPRPLRRHYFELVLANGRALTVFHRGDTERWYRQRA